MAYVLGIDFGTQSARLVIADTQTGAVLLTHAVSYAHPLPDSALIPAADYDQALRALMEAAGASPYGAQITGICVDATSLTLVPVDKDMIPLSNRAEFADRPHAQVKLWKRHHAQKIAEEATQLARAHREPCMEYTADTISSEWTLPKLIETRDADPEVYACMDYALDLCEYLTYSLTGQIVRSVGSMSFKGVWSQEFGLPGADFLNALRPGFAQEYAHLMRGEVRVCGERAGFLTSAWQAVLGAQQTVSVAAGVLDGHTAGYAMGALQDGDAALVVGTSNVLMVQTRSRVRATGLCGAALSGVTPGLYAIDSGQACAGEMLGWFVDRLTTPEIREEAAARALSVHALLCEKVTAPWENRVLALDWWNGSRCVPCDLGLTGALLGLTTHTCAQDIYLALLQGMVCGTREIIEQCAKNGAPVKRLLISGGIARKNALLMQQYADITGMEVRVALTDEGPAMGAAIIASVAAGVHDSFEAAYACMGVKEFRCYQPDTAHRADYEALYARNHAAREAISKL